MSVAFSAFVPIVVLLSRKVMVPVGAVVVPEGGFTTPVSAVSFCCSLHSSIHVARRKGFAGSLPPNMAELLAVKHTSTSKHYLRIKCSIS